MRMLSAAPSLSAWEAQGGFQCCPHFLAAWEAALLPRPADANVLAAVPPLAELHTPSFTLWRAHAAAWRAYPVGDCSDLCPQ